MKLAYLLLKGVNYSLTTHEFIQVCNYVGCRKEQKCGQFQHVCVSCVLTFFHRLSFYLTISASSYYTALLISSLWPFSVCQQLIKKYSNPFQDIEKLMDCRVFGSLSFRCKWYEELSLSWYLHISRPVLVTLPPFFVLLIFSFHSKNILVGKKHACDRNLGFTSK